MVLGFIVFSGVAFLVLAEHFMPKPGKTPEQELGDALIRYLSKGVKVRIEPKDD